MSLGGSVPVSCHKRISPIGSNWSMSTRQRWIPWCTDSNISNMYMYTHRSHQHMCIDAWDVWDDLKGSFTLWHPPTSPSGDVIFSMKALAQGDPADLHPRQHGFAWQFMKSHSSLRFLLVDSTSPGDDQTILRSFDSSHPCHVCIYMCIYINIYIYIHTYKHQQNSAGYRHVRKGLLFYLFGDDCIHVHAKVKFSEMSLS